MNTIQHDSLMMRIQKMMAEIEDTGSSRELTPLEILMAEMLLDCWRSGGRFQLRVYRP